MDTNKEINEALNAEILRLLKAIGDPKLNDESRRDQMRREVDTLLKYYDSLNATEDKTAMQQISLEQEDRWKKAELERSKQHDEIDKWFKTEQIRESEAKLANEAEMLKVKWKELELREKELEQKAWCDKMLDAAKMRESDLREHELDLREREIEQSNRTAERESKAKEKEMAVEGVKQGIEFAKVVSGLATFCIAAGICKDQFNSMLSFEETGVVRSVSSRKVLDIFRFLKR